MDWQHVTADELASALKEVEWRQPPRPLLEFFSKFSVPKNQVKWTSRLKCNIYYYRTNYLIIMLATVAGCLYSNLPALLAISVCLLALLCLNDGFATVLNERLLKMLRKLHPPTAARLRSRTNAQGLGPPGVSPRHELRIAGAKRGVVVGLLTALAAVLLYRSQALLTLAVGLLIGGSAVMLHASFRNPNLKTRLTSARQEFRAVWRNYQFHDYTL